MAQLVKESACNAGNLGSISWLGRFPGEGNCYRASLVAQFIKDPLAMQATPVQFLGWEIPWRRDRLPTPVFLGFPCGSAGKEYACSEGDLGLIPGLGRSPGEGKGYPLQYSGLENPMDCIVHGVIESDTTERLSLSRCACIFACHDVSE